MMDFVTWQFLPAFLTMANGKATHDANSSSLVIHFQRSITSRCSGWAPNPALAHATHKIMGPWETLGNPCVGGNHFLRLTTFLSQSTFVLPLPGLPGTFIFMADRWNPSDLRDSRYVWLPLSIGGLADEALDYSFGFPSWSRVSIYWHRKWQLPEGWRKSYA